MEDAIRLYPTLLDANKNAFAQNLFVVAYHALSGAMHCALHLQDEQKLAEVEQCACEQLRQLQNFFSPDTPATESGSLTLYLSLVQIAKTRRILFQTSTSRAS